MSADVKGLHHVQPGAGRGYRRERHGSGFSYADDQGRRVEAPAELSRVASLAIPPAWRDVWISADPRSHVQAVGLDARGRRQYRYHPLWNAARSAMKFSKLATFCKALPAIRRRVARDLKCACPCREAAVAAAVVLIERGHLRVGNEVYTRDNGSYGVTTLTRRHVRVSGAHVELAFRGKSGVFRKVALDDGVLARALHRGMALRGERVFKFRGPRGRVRVLHSSHVNEYLHALGGASVTAKTFRTWAASLSCLARLAALPPPASPTAGAREVTRVVREVAARLGHTPAVCRASYVHPAVIDAYLRGALVEHASAAAHKPDWRFGGPWLRRAERSLAALLGA